MANSNFRTLTLDKLDGVASTRNYIKNGSALQNVKGWTTYADAAGTAPVDGTGGSPTVTFTRTTSSPLSLDASFLFTKDAANRQGQGASYDFTIDRADQAKVCRIDFDYEVASGTYADGDLTVWLYDVTNAQVIQPSASSILNAIGPQKKQSLSFQTNPNSTSYRLIIHVASVSALAYSLKFDNFLLGPQVVTTTSVRGPVGSIIYLGSATVPQGYLAAHGTAVSRTEYAKLFAVIGTTFGVGDGSTTFNLPDLRGIFVRGAGTHGSTIGGITYSGTLGTKQADQMQGHFHQIIGETTDGGSGGGIPRFGGSVGRDTGVGAPRTDGTNGTPRTGTETRPANIGLNAYICFNDGDTVVSSSADTRVVAARYSTAAAQSIPNGGGYNLIDFGTKTFDTTSAVTTGASWNFTAPVPGKYSVSARILFNSGGGWTNGEDSQFTLHKNGVFYCYLDIYTADVTHTSRVALQGTTMIDLKGGDYIDVRVYQGSGAALALYPSGDLNYVDINLIQGPAQIAANEKVGCRYGGTTTGGLTSGSTVSIVMNTKVFDTHGMYNTSTGEITIPVSGTYRLSFKTHINSYASGSTSGGVQLSFQKNGAGEYLVWSSSAKTTSSVTHVDFTTGEMDFIAGDKIIPRFFHGMGGAGVTLLNNVEYTWVSCVRIG